MILEVRRQNNGQGATTGYLLVDDEVVCYTLERPWQNNESNISSVPSGVYNSRLRYDHSDRWRVELIGVPGRENIQIHIGNQPDQTKGCILVGMEIDSDLSSLRRSREAYEELKFRFYGSRTPNATPNKEIVVKIVDVGSP
jgi:hypothetical protein